MRWINVGGMKVRAALAVLYDVVGVDILGTKRWKANAGELQLVAQLGTVTESVLQRGPVSSLVRKAIWGSGEGGGRGRCRERG